MDTLTSLRFAWIVGRVATLAPVVILAGCLATL